MPSSVSSYHDLAGRIEGSVWCLQGDDENGEYFDNVDGTPRTQAELVAYMEGCGLDTSKTVAFFCGDSWGAAHIAYFCQSVDINTIKEWGNGWIPWSNEGNEFVVAANEDSDDCGCGCGCRWKRRQRWN